MKKIGILFHPKVSATRLKAEELARFLQERGIAVWLCSAWEKDEASCRLNGTDILLAVGGDGTILRAAQVVIPGDTPIVGINLGRLGFMTELNSDEAPQQLLRLLDGEGWADERAMLQAEIPGPSGGTLTVHALNDIVVARGEVVRLIRAEVTVDGEHLAGYKADAVVLATATGSTGYALAAGGAIIYPHSRDYQVIPVAPHLCPPYPIVLPGEAVVGIRLESYHPALVSVDGHINLSLANGAGITVKRSPHVIRFLRLQPKNSFYRRLEGRLVWK
ncbi:MAG: NAD(+)/NADH kinase [Dehalococcoidales bacterium]|nr:NAD(+)/NADH kinase [Dehalococcoidales bacterium]